jgi:hypothetical protein
MARCIDRPRRRRAATRWEEKDVDVTTVAALLREAEEHHGQYEPTALPHHWSEYYAAYIVAREQGRPPEQAATDAADHIAAVLR